MAKSESGATIPSNGDKAWKNRTVTPLTKEWAKKIGAEPKPDSKQGK